jgi:predicted nucleotidyltransferase
MIPLLLKHKSALDELCRRHHVRRLEIFGSAASDRFDPASSDLDFLVEFESLPRGAYADNYFGFLEALESLFERPVDLVSVSAIKNPYFREAVDQTKALLYAA